MQKNYFSIKRLIPAVALAVLSGTSLVAQITQTFTFTGAVQNFVVPSCVSNVTIEVWGAQGGVNTPTSVTNYGGYAKAVFNVNAGDNLNIYAGSQPSTTAGGYNGGGTGDNLGRGGGGASDVRLNGNALADRIIVAGGGGGGGYWASQNLAVSGGVGGGTVGGDGLRIELVGTSPGGLGGTQVANATNGFCSTAGNGPSAGSLGQGGNIIVGACGCDGGYGGGGGYYGGGAGGNCRGGGGGSGYFLPAATGTVFTSGNNAGHGKVVITYVTNGAGVVASSSSSLICTGGSVALTASNVLSYTWSPGGSNASSISVSPTSNTSYTVRGTNSIGCVSSVVLPIIVSGSAPSLTVTSSTPTTCLGNTVSISASGAITYTFSNGISNGVAFTPNSTNTYTITGTNGCGATTANITITVATLPVTAGTTSSLICSGSPATLTAGGATTYTWLPGSSNSTTNIVFPTANTIYTLTGKTGSCQGVATLTVNTKALPTLSIITNSTTLCFGDSENLNVSGNATTYTWTPGGSNATSILINPANTAAYSVAGTNSLNCTSSVTQIISVVQNPVLAISASNPTVCANGSSTLTVSGATGSYLWAVSGAVTSTLAVNPLQTTVYTVTGTNLTSCHTTTMITVNVFEPSVSISSNTSVCLGSFVSVGASGADSYLWLNNSAISAGINVNPTTNTTYTVVAMVSDNGLSCPATATVNVTVNALPAVTAISSPTAICRGKSAVITVDGAGATGTYTWSGGLGNTSTISVSPILDQSYAVAGTDANGCKGTATTQVVVSPCTGINTIAASAINLVIYPNPSTGDFTIAADQVITLNIVNELGQLIKVINLDATTREAKVNNLANGVYFISGKNENGNVREKIIVGH